MAYEVGLADITVHKVKPEQLKEKIFLTLNPNGEVPVLIDEARSGNCKYIFECGAVCDYLLHISNHNLFPESWTDDNWV